VQAAAALLVLAGAARSAATPPQYRFDPGDYVIYEQRSSDAGSQDAAAGRRAHVHVWCLSETADGMLLLIARTVVPAPGQLRATHGLLVSIDARGQRELSPTMRRRWPAIGSLLDVIPLLPTPLQRTDHWRTPPDPFGLIRACRAREGKPASGMLRIDFDEYWPDFASAAVGQRRRGRFAFATAEGLVRRVAVVKSHPPAEQTVTILRERQRRTPGWVAARQVEAQRWQRALAYEDELAAALRQDPARTEALIDRLQRYWRARLDEFAGEAGSPFALLCRARVRTLSETAKRWKAEAAYLQRWRGRSAIGWSLQDPSGQTVSSESVRRTPSVEFLWSQRDTQSLATVHALAALEPELAQRGLRLTGLNVDANAGAAARILGELDLPGTQLLAESLLRVEVPPRLPVVRVIGEDGTIRMIQVGWQPSWSGLLPEAKRDGSP
jgi:hypothetical protein